MTDQPKPPGPAGPPCPLTHEPCPPDCVDRAHCDAHAEPASPDASAPFIASRPDIVYDKPDVVEFTAKVTNVEINREALAVLEHPVPWRWIEGVHFLTLDDARGMPMIFVDRFDSAGAREPVPSLGVRALTESAPDLLAMLRRVTAELRSHIRSDYETTRDRTASRALAESPVLEAEALLARIDKAGR